MPRNIHTHPGNSRRKAAIILLAVIVLTLAGCHKPQPEKKVTEKPQPEPAAVPESPDLPDLGIFLQEPTSPFVQKRIEISPANGSLADALQKVENSEIILTPGKYELTYPLTLDRNVTIRGTSSEEVTIECASGYYVFMISGGSPRLENLKIVFHSNSSACEAVRVLGGTPTLKNCSFISNSGGGLFIYGYSTHIKVDSCVITECGTTGILGVSGAIGEFTGCDIGNNWRGVTIGDKAKFTFQNCHIHDSEEHGVLISKNAVGNLQDCTISRSKRFNVMADLGGEVILTRCRISDAQQGGVLVLRDGKGTFHGNTLKNNRNDGVETDWGIALEAKSVTGSDNQPPIPDISNPGSISGVQIYNSK